MPTKGYRTTAERKAMLDRRPSGKAKDRLRELMGAADAFRTAMIECGALSRTPQDMYLAQLRRLETALSNSEEQ